MPTVQLSMLAGAGAQFFGDNGRPLSGGKVYTYNAGTTTPRAVYTTSAGTVAHANPIVLDAAGRVPAGGEIWVEAEVSYKFALTTWTNVPVGDWDNITGNGSGIFPVLSAPSGSSLIGFIQSGVGAVARTAQSKMRERVSVEDFGAVGDGVTDSTVAIKNCFDYAIPLGIPVELGGTYLISGPLQPYAGRASGAVEIICRGDVTINVSAGATAFADLLYFETSAVNSCSITGGTLTINANNKCARGITFRHTNATQGGRVAITTPVTINNLFDADASATREVTGIVVHGLYEDVTILNPRVVGVRRTNTAQASKGIAVVGYEGTVLIDKSYIKDVLLPAGATSDCDGIAVFAKAGATAYALRQGSEVIRDGVFIDCAGRAVKSQSSNTQIIRPIVKRQFATPIPGSVDFDFQLGGGTLVQPQFEYLKNGASSPLSATHLCVAFQQRCETTTFGQMVARSKDAVIRTEVAIYIYAGLSTSATATRHETIIDGLVIEPLNAFWAAATTAITRSVLEFDANVIATQTAEEVTIRVNRVKGPIQAYFLGYTGLGAPTAISKLRLEAIDNENTLQVGGARLLNAQSGQNITGLGAFKFAGNSNIRTLLASGFGFDFRALQVGTAFSALIDGATFSNAPPWGVSGTATVHCTSAYFGNNDRTVQVWLNNATATPSYWFTLNGGTTWGQIK
jgi:hypothetical protein